MRENFQCGDVDGFGAMLEENWRLKRTLTPQISNDQIDDWYAKATAAGATGGKLLGAGGFLMFYAPLARHDAIEQALAPLRRSDFGFEPAGSKVIFYDPQDSR